MRIAVCGDTAPTVWDEEKFKSGIAETFLSKELFEYLHLADYLILNLETPICGQKDEIEKCGPCLCADPATMEGICGIAPDLVTLANNHIMDQNAQGLKETENILKQAGIPYTGVGDNLKEACKPYVTMVEDIKLGIYACAEREFSIVNEDAPGANPFDPLYSLDHVQELSAQCDYVIVLYHGGKEHYRYPSPDLQKVCRRLVEKGANLVVCQHSHCIGCKEEYRNGTIVYGQGNFIFAGSNDEFWHSGLVITVDIEKTAETVRALVDYIPIVRSNDDMVVLPAEDEREQILQDFQMRSEEISVPGVVGEKYRVFSKDYERYLDACQGERARFRNKVIAHLPAWMKKPANKLFCSAKAYSRDGYLALQNFIECEAHRELFITLLKEKIKGSVE